MSSSAYPPILFSCLIYVATTYTVGPAVEAFGFERIIFGSAPSPTSRATSSAGDWYEIARESFAELGVDQETVDGIFGNNAKRVYGARS